MAFLEIKKKTKKKNNKDLKGFLGIYKGILRYLSHRVLPIHGKVTNQDAPFFY